MTAIGQTTQSLAGEMFLPYQLEWLRCKDRFKIWEKSRRIGGTWTQSFEDVLDCIEQPGLKVFFSSADATAAAEYGDYIDDWVGKFNRIVSVATRELEHGDIESDAVFADEDKGLRTKVKEFSNGSKLYLLTSNPKAFRSKGGKIVWDEAAWHDNASKMWAAARPAAMWGYPIRILSTHNGAGSTFNQLVKLSRSGVPGWHHHRVTILDAAAQGLVSKILKHAATQQEIDDWIAQERAGCLSEDEWLQEYMCEARDAQSALISYEAIAQQGRPDLLLPLSRLRDLGPLYLGYDIARTRHLSVIYVLEQCGPSLVCRHLVVMQGQTFAEQEKRLFELMAIPNVRRACIDATGMGAAPTERAIERFGKARVEAVTFSPTVKADLAKTLLGEFENRVLFLPSDLEGGGAADQREGIHAVRRVVTTSGNVRYDAVAGEHGHADHFWALALGVHAARDGSHGAGLVLTRPRRTVVPGFVVDMQASLNRWRRTR